MITWCNETKSFNCHTPPYSQACVCACVCVRIYVHTCMRVSVHTCMRTYMRERVCVCNLLWCIGTCKHMYKTCITSSCFLEWVSYISTYWSTSICAWSVSHVPLMLVALSSADSALSVSSAFSLLHLSLADFRPRDSAASHDVFRSRISSSN